MFIEPIRPFIERVARIVPHKLATHIASRVSSGAATHEERVAFLALRIYERGTLRKNDIDRAGVLMAALFHDIGKNGVQDEILLKPGRLSDDEYAAVQTHVEKTEWVLARCGALDRIPFIAASHHERWDGAGYPRGLSEREIPYFARIITIADIWDALLHERAYKERYPVAECLTVLRAIRGTIADPALTDLFIEEWSSLTRSLR